MKLLYNDKEVYRETYKLYQYNDNDYRIVCQKYAKDKGFEQHKDVDFYRQIEEFMGLTPTKVTSDVEIQRTSLSRTKRMIRELALCNSFTYFATITVNSKNCDRYSLDKCQNLLKYTIKEKIRRKNKDFAYIFITEKHKDGAFHFHGLVRNLDLYINNNGYFSNSAFDKIGYNSFSKIKDYSKCCNYITKYITKECIKNSHNQIYISSRGLKKATSYNIKPIDIKWNYKNDFVKLSDFSLSDLSEEQILNFMRIEEEI